ncbi:hypothetical protein PBAL39_02022 [Pedobacter sp. BAL39]|nr:hypothetical protein PBAL39_02022 [Pedobacter sp. BAL39]
MNENFNYGAMKMWEPKTPILFLCSFSDALNPAYKGV